MSHSQIWHAFYYDRSGSHAAPCRTEVIEAANEEAAARVARAHLGECKKVSIESPAWMHRGARVIFAEEEKRRAALH